MRNFLFLFASLSFMLFFGCMKENAQPTSPAPQTQEQKKSDNQGIPPDTPSATDQSRFERIPFSPEIRLTIVGSPGRVLGSERFDSVNVYDAAGILVQSGYYSVLFTNATDTSARFLLRNAHPDSSMYRVFEFQVKAGQEPVLRVMTQEEVAAAVPTAVSSGIWEHIFKRLGQRGEKCRKERRKNKSWWVQFRDFVVCVGVGA